MKSCRIRIVVFFAVACLKLLSAPAVGGYSDNNQLGKTLKALASKNESWMRVRPLTRSLRGNDIWSIELGEGNDKERNRRPAMLVIGGLEGEDLVGGEVLVSWVKSLASAYKTNGEVKQLLGRTTIHVIPRLNPDASSLFFARPQWASSSSLLPTDDDHDGLIDEDGPDDLDGNGVITMMRVSDPEGDYALDPVDSRFMVKADRSKGEAGGWKLFVEGIDNDKDKEWNEDAPGGVNFNRNFPHGFKFFTSGSGRHPVSEVETRALATLVIEHPNIGIVFTFGSLDLLGKTPKAEPAKRPQLGILEADLPYFKELGNAWREKVGIKKEKELGQSSVPGSFAEWIYFQRGRLALSTPAWSPALQLEFKKAPEKVPEQEPSEDSKNTEPKPGSPPEKRPPADERNQDERAFVNWLELENPGSFIPWKEFNHPDFPGQRVEIGGLKPFARTNPPEKLLEDISSKHIAFLSNLAGRLPRIAIRKKEAVHLGRSVFDVTLQVENTGYLPTVLAHGETTRAVLQTRVVLKLEAPLILSGTRVTRLGPIPGLGGMVETRWIVHAKDRKSIGVEIISSLAGSLDAEIELPGAGGTR